MATPNFIYVGTGKSGSTWLHQVCQKHPDIFVTPVKETNYFDLNYGRGIGWYEDFFQNARENQIVGEISHRYMRSDKAVSRIKQDLGEIKILAFFRDPSEYFLSDYLFTVRNGGFSGTVEDWADNGFDWDSILYADLIRPYVEAFSKGNVMIGNFKDIGHDPESLLKNISNFLSIPEFPSDAVNIGRVNPAKSPRNKVLSRIVSSTSKALKRKGGQRIIAAFKYSRVVQGLLYKNLSKKPEIPAVVREKIISHSAEDIKWLDSTFDTALEEMWCK
jgi:hypothetical protein